MNITFEEAQQFLRNGDVFEVNGKPHTIGFNDPWCRPYISSGGINGHYLSKEDTLVIQVDDQGSALIFATNRHYEPYVVIKSYSLRRYQ